MKDDCTIYTRFSRVTSQQLLAILAESINLSIDDVRKVKLQSIQTAARHATNITKRTKNDITSTPNA